MVRYLAFLLALLALIGSAIGEDAGPAIEGIALGSGNGEYKPQPLWKPIRDCKPDLWIWLGDIVYGRADDLPELARKYRHEKSQPEYQAMRDHARVIGTWDDNDYGVSDGGKDNPNKAECQR